MQSLNKYTKLIWLNQQFPDHEVIVELDNPNIIHSFNLFVEVDHEERLQCHFRQNDLTLEKFYTIKVLSVLDDDD